ncbi:HNH endonuclease [Anaeromyxobacter sp. Fw109-5]|uniref:HNH endonuclease n=1 Tax=Anaeromyxobacter sp. (strain Fw109-5) TaxID=404589 RepID=UPI0000ED8057|nr:HNH endonuclease signature motif containing protein [Anaeromyxobacter sp. Fw109-5]ABS25027.1 HNH endonuclease [Anaeromyxobacter sp. Fw109-5]
MSTARELTNHLVRLLREEQGAMADVLLALADFDRKKLWRELGHTSLFYYLYRELRLSKGAAQNRKTAAELIQAFPEVEAALRAGELCLSTVNELAKVLTPENRAEVLPRFFGLSRREAEAVAVSLRPAEVVPTRDVITAFRPAAIVAATAQAVLLAPSPESAALRVHPDEPVVVHLDEPTSPVVVAAPIPLPSPPPRESVERLDAELARVHVTVSRRFLEKLEAATDALGHACPGGSAAEILERGLDLILAQHAKRRGLVEKPRKSRRGSRRDTIPAEVKREVWRRAGGQCEWRFESGERCDCRRRLEYDHIEPLALGGASTMDNVRLACRPHNLLSARQIFGDAVMDRYCGVGG